MWSEASFSMLINYLHIFSDEVSGKHIGPFFFFFNWAIVFYLFAYGFVCLFVCFYYFWYWVWRILCVFWITVLLQMYLLQIFSLIYELFLFSFHNVFFRAKVFHFVKSSLFIFSFMNYVFDALSKKIYPHSRSLRLSPLLSYRRFIVLRLFNTIVENIF